MPDQILSDLYLVPLPKTKPQKDPLRRVVRRPPQFAGVRGDREAALLLDGLTSGWGVLPKEDDDGME